MIFVTKKHKGKPMRQWSDLGGTMFITAFETAVVGVGAKLVAEEEGVGQDGARWKKGLACCHEC